MYCMDIQNLITGYKTKASIIHAAMHYKETYITDVYTAILFTCQSCIVLASTLTTSPSICAHAHFKGFIVMTSQGASMGDGPGENHTNLTDEQDLRLRLKQRLAERRKTSLFLQEKLMQARIASNLRPATAAEFHARLTPKEKFVRTATVLGKVYLAWRYLAKRTRQNLVTKYFELMKTAQSDTSVVFEKIRLSEAERAVLCKNLEDRTNEDLNTLSHLVEKLECFEKIFGGIQSELASLAYLDAYEKGNVIVRQGRSGKGFYYILSGQVCIVLETMNVIEDPFSQEKKEEVSFEIVGYLKAGQTFGELALLLKGERKATVICLCNTEVIRIDQDDFEQLLQKNSQAEWATKTTYIKSHPLFSTWPAHSICEVMEQSHIRKYSQNTVVVSDLCNSSEYIYFVISGGCKVAYEVQMCEEVLSTGFIRVTLPPDSDNATLASTKKFIKKYWHVGNLLPGDHFGVGEGNKNTYVIADMKTQCLLVNALVFHKYDRGRLFEIMKLNKRDIYPLQQEFFYSYKRQREWSDYKHTILEEVLKKKHERKSLSKWRSCDCDINYQRKI